MSTATGTAGGGKELTASQEDYLEAVLLEVRQRGSARVRDIAARLAVAMPSVTAALKTLARRRLVHYSPYELVTLTGRGRRRAEKVAGRHRLLREFFTDVLGVGAEAAERNACRIEHAVDDEVLRRLRRFVEFVSTDEAAGGELAAFKRHLARRR